MKTLRHSNIVPTSCGTRMTPRHFSIALVWNFTENILMSSAGQAVCFLKTSCLAWRKIQQSLATTGPHVTAPHLLHTSHEKHSWFQAFAMFRMLFVFFWVIPRRLIYICLQIVEGVLQFPPHRGEVFLISSFRRVQNVVCFLLGDSPASDLYMPIYAYINQTPGNHPKENKQHEKHVKQITVRVMRESALVLWGLPHQTQAAVRYRYVTCVFRIKSISPNRHSIIHFVRFPAVNYRVNSWRSVYRSLSQMELYC